MSSPIHEAPMNVILDPRTLKLRSQVSTKKPFSGAQIWAGGCALLSLVASSGGPAQWIHIFDADVPPEAGDVPMIPPLPIRSGGFLSYAEPTLFSRGIYVANSLEFATYVPGGEDLMVFAKISTS